MEELEPVWGVRCTSTLLSGHHCPVRGEICSEVAGAEALRFWLKLVLLPLSVCFSFFLHWAFDPKVGSAEANGAQVLIEG